MHTAQFCRVVVATVPAQKSARHAEWQQSRQGCLHALRAAMNSRKNFTLILIASMPSLVGTATLLNYLCKVPLAAGCMNRVADAIQLHEALLVVGLFFAACRHLRPPSPPSQATVLGFKRAGNMGPAMRRGGSRPGLGGRDALRHLRHRLLRLRQCLPRRRAKASDTANVAQAHWIRTKNCTRMFIVPSEPLAYTNGKQILFGMQC